ncbi:sigma-70 family RNA polymerase sigma factor [Cytobacillus luteolus]|uniref:sigma-70 family RNA polymerase sigma factor n=1 Tax=Litchfieldia luteola TaxID=682179 RepID=UPI001874A9D4|nr:sigma-70 family RNA polymerase sigma factor [Cytobacillus luteolus]
MLDIQKMSFDELVEVHRPLILHVLKTLHIYKDHEVYYQVGLVGLWEAQSRYNPEKGAFSTFAFSIIRGRVLSSLTKENQFYTRYQPTEHEEQLDAAYDESSEIKPEEDILTTYCFDLTENQRKWVIGKIIEDKKIKDIALEHGVTEDAVKTWRREALKKLRKTVAGMDIR